MVSCMWTRRLTGLPGGRSINSFDSVNFTVASLARDAHVSVVSLAAGGRIGRHPAGADQCLVVLSGDATVSGRDGLTVDVTTGEVVVWDAGEEHETTTAEGLLALVVEAEGLAARMR
jgi:quercetin dioxygenase-like cupin family protein